MTHRKAWVVVALLVVAALASGCGFVRTATRTPTAVPTAASAVITATDGRSQVSVPGGWSARTDLHDEAELQAANERESLFLIILGENKFDFDMTLDEYTEITLGSLADAADSPPTVSEAKRLTIGGLPAIQHTVAATVDKYKITYLFTTVEGEVNYFQVVAWTLQSRFSVSEPVFQGIVQSFKELQP